MAWCRRHHDTLCQQERHLCGPRKSNLDDGGCTACSNTAESPGAVGVLLTASKMKNTSYSQEQDTIIRV